MRYVCDIGKAFFLFSLLIIAACVRADPPSLKQNSREIIGRSAPLALDDHGCLSRAVAHRRQYFERAAATIHAVSPHAADSAYSADAIVELEPPVLLDLLDPQSGLAEIFHALPAGSYKSAQLRISSVEIVLRAQAKVEELDIPGQSIELAFLVPLTIPERSPERWGISSCVDTLQVREGSPRFTPARIQVSTAAPQE